jgi:hypothetical protein
MPVPDDKILAIPLSEAKQAVKLSRQIQRRIRKLLEKKAAVLKRFFRILP